MQLFAILGYGAAGNGESVFGKGTGQLLISEWVVLVLAIHQFSDEMVYLFH